MKAYNHDFSWEGTVASVCPRGRIFEVTVTAPEADVFVLHVGTHPMLQGAQVGTPVEGTFEVEDAKTTVTSVG